MPPGQTLDGEARLAERERPEEVCAHQCRTRSLSARSALPPHVKGGIARAPGLLVE